MCAPRDPTATCSASGSRRQWCRPTLSLSTASSNLSLLVCLSSLINHTSLLHLCVCMTSARGNPEPHDAADARTTAGRANSTTAAASTKTTTPRTDCVVAVNQVCTFDQHAVVDGDCTGTAHGSGICACAAACCSRCTSTRTAQAAVCACDARDACVGACASPVQALWRSCARHHCRC